MISEEEIREWWEIKIDNYIKNYARQKKLSLTQVKEMFSQKLMKTFHESIPQAFKKIFLSCS